MVAWKIQKVYSFWKEKEVWGVKTIIVIVINIYWAIAIYHNFEHNCLITTQWGVPIFPTRTDWSSESLRDFPRTHSQKETCLQQRDTWSLKIHKGKESLCLNLFFLHLCILSFVYICQVPGTLRLYGVNNVNPHLQVVCDLVSREQASKVCSLESLLKEQTSG